MKGGKRVGTKVSNTAEIQQSTMVEGDNGMQGRGHRGGEDE